LKQGTDILLPEDSIMTAATTCDEEGYDSIPIGTLQTLP